MEGKIGFFDSGVGGISVLREAVRLLPQEQFVYYGDNANAPYGIKSEREILALTQNAIQSLMANYPLKALVIACNTATSAAAKTLRAQLDIPVVGMEPALKPAHEHRSGGQIIVLATHATLHQEKFHLLMEKYGEGALCVEGTGLVELVEQGIVEGPQAEKALHRILDKPLLTQTDSIVLGCTHYPFLINALRRVAGSEIEILDSAGGTTRQLKRVLAQHRALKCDGSGSVTLLSSKNGDQTLKLMRRLLALS